MNRRLSRWLAALLTACILMTIPAALSEAEPELIGEAFSEMVEPEVSLEEDAALPVDGEGVADEVTETAEADEAEAGPYVYALTRYPETWIYSDAALTDALCSLTEGETVLVTGTWDGAAAVSFNTDSGAVSGYAEADALTLLDAGETGDLLSDLAGSGSLSLYDDDINWPLFLADAELIEKGYQLVTVSELLSFHKDGAKPGATYTRVEPKDRVNGQ